MKLPQLSWTCFVNNLFHFCCLSGLVWQFFEISTVYFNARDRNEEITECLFPCLELHELHSIAWNNGQIWDDVSEIRRRHGTILSEWLPYFEKIGSEARPLSKHFLGHRLRIQPTTISRTRVHVSGQLLHYVQLFGGLRLEDSGKWACSEIFIQELRMLQCELEGREWFFALVGFWPFGSKTQTAWKHLCPVWSYKERG